MTPAKHEAILVQAKNNEAQQESTRKSSKLRKKGIPAKKATPAKRKAESS
jgi:hypothetical protein